MTEVTTITKDGATVLVGNNVLNIETFSECDFYRTFKYVKNENDVEVPISLAGASMRMMVRKRASSATALIDMSIANERIVPDYTQEGVFTVRIPFSELSVLSEDVYVHSLIATWSTGLREQIWRGTMTHKIGPTR